MMNLSAPAPAPAANFKPSPARCRVAHSWLHSQTYQLLEIEAQHRRLHPDALAAIMLETLLDENLVAALLDR